MSVIISFTIAETEQETGIGRDTLRVWERRYGFPAPLRNRCNERMYSREQLERLRLIKQLLDRGMQPGKLVKLDDSQLRHLTLPPEDVPPLPTDVTVLLKTLTGKRLGELLPRLEALLQQHGLMFFLTDVIAPMNSAVGEAWFRGGIGILDEHFYVEQLRIVLTAALHSLPPGRREPKVLLTTLPGEQHGLALLMVACTLRLAGAEVLLLGVQTPLDEIVRGAVESRCAVVGISCSEYMGQRTIAAQLFKLRKLLPATVALWAGGSGVAGVPAMPAGVQLFHDLRDIPAAII